MHAEADFRLRHHDQINLNLSDVPAAYPARHLRALDFIPAGHSLCCFLRSLAAGLPRPDTASPRVPSLFLLKRARLLAHWPTRD
jgi:hypothetical protein